MNPDNLPGIRPRPTLGRQLDMAARRSLPASVSALLLLASAAPLGLAGQAEVQQSVALSCVFFWSLYRPASMPPVAVFLLGVLADLLSFAPIGVGVVTLLAAHGFALRWRRALAKRGFVAAWLVFLALAAGAAVLEWALASLLTFRLLPPLPGVFQAGLSAGLYPLLALLFVRAHHTLAEPERA